MDCWQAEFVAMGKAQAGGSGSEILTYSPRDKRLVNSSAADHRTTLATRSPVLVLDMHEHLDTPEHLADRVTPLA